MIRMIHYQRHKNVDGVCCQNWIWWLYLIVGTIVVITTTSKMTSTTMIVVHAESSSITINTDSSSSSSSDDTIRIVKAKSLDPNHKDIIDATTTVDTILSEDFDGVVVLHNIPEVESFNDLKVMKESSSTTHDGDDEVVYNHNLSRSQYMHQQLQQIMHKNHIDALLTTTNNVKSSTLQLIIHPNGRASCQHKILVTSSFSTDDPHPYHEEKGETTTKNNWVNDKYQMEATMTEYIASSRRWNYNNEEEDDCWSSPRTTIQEDDDVDDEGSSTSVNRKKNTFYHYCDMGTNYTVIQKDFTQLVRVGNNNSDDDDDDAKKNSSLYLPCRFYTKEGVRIVSISHLQSILFNQQREATAQRRRMMKEDDDDDDDDECREADTNDNYMMESSLDIDGTPRIIDTAMMTESPPPMREECLIRSTTTNTLYEVHIYAVPAGRVFMFAPSYIGEIFTLSHIILPKPPTTTTTTTISNDSITTTNMNDNTTAVDSTVISQKDISIVSLEVLSVVPPIFDIHHFFSQSESEQLTNKALAEQSETYRFHRSTTGTSSSNVYSQRTSENAWDTHGATAQLIKRRCFQLLGFDEYQEEMTDGLQILRYNLTTAYISHLDYLQDNEFVEPYDYDTSKKGGNRFATILLYFTTLNENDGGETVFPRVYPPGIAEKDRISEKEGLRLLRQSGDAKSILKIGSWEEKMTVLCRTRFSVRPKALRAVLFYSQHPNGTIDPLSYHGGCPVLRGTKMAANLWTWSAIRPEFDGGPIRDGADVSDYDYDDSDSNGDLSETDESEDSVSSIRAIFRNSGNDERFRNAELYYDEAGYFGKLGFDDIPISVNTYSGHVWNIKDEVTKAILQTYIIPDDSGEDQIYEI